MSVKVEKLDGGMAKLIIEVAEADFEKAVEQAYLKQRNKISIPGFRKGKAPRAMIEKMYGKEVFFQDAAGIQTCTPVIDGTAGRQSRQCSQEKGQRRQGTF